MIKTKEEHSSRFEEDLKIDPMALDVEWMLQPQTFFKYGEELAKANRELDRIKLEYEVVQAETYSNAKNKLLKDDLKVTEAAIKNEVIQNKDVIRLAEKVSDQKEVVDLLAIGVKAFEQRKTALENLVKLQIQNYNAAPKEPRDLNVEYGKRMQQEKIRNEMAISSSNRRK